MTQPVLMPIIGKESGDRWVMVGTWGGKDLKVGPWQYSFRLHGNSYRLTIPNGFDKADGASVPRPVQGIVKMGGREMPDEAWLPHDFIYNYKGKMPKGSLVIWSGDQWKEVKRVNKKFADQMFHNELRSKDHGLSSFKPIVAYVGVRAAFWKNF